MIRKVHPDHLYKNTIGFTEIFNFLEAMSALSLLYICQS